MAATVRLGTRGSALALAQAAAVARRLGGAEAVPIVTSGDRRRGEGDKSRFVREIEHALLEGSVDIAVHSAKDVPTEIPDGLELVAIPGREEPRDALAGAAGSIAALPGGARVGTSSLRRRAQLLALRPDLEILELRGNVDTRLGRLTDGDFDALVLAAAGLVRLGRKGDIAGLIPEAEMVPAPGQGALALQTRTGDERAARLAAGLADAAAGSEVAAERACVAALGATCRTPVGVLAQRDSARLVIDGFAGLPDGSEWVRDRVTLPADRPGEAGEELARRLLAAGAGDVLARAEEQAPAGERA